MSATGKEQELEGKHGKLIALEGDTNILWTQLKLLPLSPKILAIPAVSENLTDEEKFDAREHIRRAHIAFAERIDRARAFLSSSTSTHPRLAFMNGGSVSARSNCIAKISENVTDGDVLEAENVFNLIVKDGVAGLMRDMDENEEQTERNLGEVDKESIREEEDPSSRVMKAAGSLERETAALQLDAQGLFSSQVGAMGANQSAEGPPREHNIFRTEHGEELVETVFTIRDKRGTFGPGYKTDDYTRDSNAPSPGSESNISAPATPRVVYGEARIVDVASASPTRVRRKSVEIDWFYPSNSRSLILPHPPIPRPMKRTKSAHNLGMRSRSPKPLVPMLPLDLGGFQKFPRTTSFVKGSETTIRKSPTLSTSGRSSSAAMRPSVASTYVNRGTDAEDLMKSYVIEDSEEATNIYKETGPFVPVFPVVEDFILQLFNGKPNKITESVIRSAKDGTYPPPFLPSSAISGEFEPPTSPISASSMRHENKRPNRCSHLKEQTDEIGHARDDFDQYASDEYPPDIQRSWTQDQSSRDDDPIAPPARNGISEKFVEFSPPSAGNAINVQNSLRHLLSMHFPAGEYSQHYHAVVPEMNRLWKPVFRNDEHSSVGKEDSTVDQIVALGCEEGVKKDFFYQISGQIEKLGTERDGTSRSCKLDIGYLIGNALQGTDALSFSSSTSSNPLSNPTLLAILLVPHIEAFLASNVCTRFLILHYPASQFATVLALRKLLGSELFKVAGILDSLASDPPFTRPLTPLSIRPQSPLTGNVLSNEAVAARSSSRHDPFSSTRLSSLTTLKLQVSRLVLPADALGKSPSGPSFAKADFLLPSTATDGEITAFLSSIWRSLMDKSTFYTPEPEAKSVIIDRPLPLPPTPATSPLLTRDALGRDSSRFSSTFRGTSAKFCRLTGTTAAGSRLNYEPSVTSTVKHNFSSSTASIKSRSTESSQRKATGAPAGGEWENFYIEDDDSEDDEYDKMILGRAMARIMPDVRNPEPKARDKKKALKWLGLA